MEELVEFEGEDEAVMEETVPTGGII